MKAAKLFLLCVLMPSLSFASNETLVATKKIIIEAWKTKTDIPVIAGKCHINHDAREYARFIYEDSVFQETPSEGPTTRLTVHEFLDQIRDSFPGGSLVNDSDFNENMSLSEVKKILAEKYGLTTIGATDWPTKTIYTIKLLSVGTGKSYDMTCVEYLKGMSEIDLLNLFIDSPLSPFRGF